MMVEERRPAPRIRVQAPTEYENSHTGSGLTENVSLSGVLIERASVSIAIQTEIRLRFSFFMGSFGTEFRGTVVRHTEDGFAVQFSEMNEAQLEVLQMLPGTSEPGGTDRSNLT